MTKTNRNGKIKLLKTINCNEKYTGKTEKRGRWTYKIN